MYYDLTWFSFSLFLTFASFLPKYRLFSFIPRAGRERKYLINNNAARTTQQAE